MTRDVHNDSTADNLPGQRSSGGPRDQADSMLIRETNQQRDVGFDFRKSNGQRGFLVRRGIGGVKGSTERTQIDLPLHRASQLV